MEHLAEIAIRRAASRAQPPTFQVLPAGLLGSRQSWTLGNLPSPGARRFRVAPPGALPVLCLLGRLIPKPHGEVHITWIEVSALAIVTGGLVAGFVSWTALLVDRSDGEQKQTGEMLESNKCS